METLQRIRNWFAALFGYSRRNSDLRDEIECHIEMRTDMNIDAGMSHKAARTAAIKQFGGIDKLKEQCRDTWGIRVIVDQLRNIAFGLRLSTRYPSSSILAVLVLGTGIAISIIMYTVSIKFLGASAGGNIDETHLELQWDKSHWYNNGIHTQDFKVIREEIESLEELVAMGSTRAWFNLPGNSEDNKQYKGLLATSNFFDLTDTTPLRGRLFSKNAVDDQSSGEIVITHTLWRDFFNQDESAIGSPVFVDNKEYMVVGVMPIGFAFPKNQLFWISTDWQKFNGVNPKNTPRLDVVGKLRQGVTIEQALAELKTLSENLSGAALEPGAEKLKIHLRPYKNEFTGDNVRVPLYIFIGGAFLVLMLACSNVFHIIISRTARRSHELAVRCSLGAKRGHIMWQVIVDGLTLSGLGAILGFSLAALGLHFFSEYLESFTSIPGANTFHLKSSTALFTIGAALVTGIAASALPAWRASKINAFPILKDDSNSSSSIFVGWLSKAVVISQIAFSAVVIFLSYLFLVIIPSQYWSKNTDLPYNENSLLTAQVGLPYKTFEENIRFYTQLKEKLKEVPGVRATALSSGPAGFMGDKHRIEFEFQKTESSQTNYFAQISSVTPDYLEAYDLNLISGRMFTILDTSKTAPVCVVNSQFVKSYCNNVDPIGMRLKFDNHHDPDPSEWITIIGVVPNHKPEFPIVPTESILVSYAQPLLPGPNGPTIVVSAESAANPRYRQALRRAVRELAPRAVFQDGVLTVKERIDVIFGILGTLSTAGRIFGGSILLMSMVGLYSIISFTTSQRRKEFGIRMAVGSTGWGIAKTVLKPWLLMIGIGLPLGFIGVMGLPAIFMSYMASIQAPAFDLSPFADIGLPYFLVSIIICFSSFIATAVPVWRATRIPPMDVIRKE